MMERPVLFNGPMVRAILEGRKTQTRRLIRPEKYLAVDFEYAAAHKGSADWLCPYGVPGDRLWVRETWGFDSTIRHDFKPVGRYDLSGTDLLEHVRYRADVPDEREERAVRRLARGHVPPWRPSIHMRRWASRIDLEVTDVRVQRLQDISEEDARAEGFSSDPVPGVLTVDGKRKRSSIAFLDPRSWFFALWDGINDSRTLKVNPWVWAVSFRKLEASR